MIHRRAASISMNENEPADWAADPCEMDADRRRKSGQIECAACGDWMDLEDWKNGCSCECHKNDEEGTN